MPDPLISRRLGRYDVKQEIGRGGMARVYRAVDTLLQRTVALKILAPQFSNDPEFAHRFEREAVTAANLRHPAIITIFDVGEAEGLRYIAMEYIGGSALSTALTEHGAFSLPLTVAVLRPIADALDAAHRSNAVHRDIKPQNILLDTDGRVLLTDFGIAIGPQQGGERLTRAGSFMGTPEYLAPEQVQGQQVTGASDRYALGVV
ncbi:MAG: Serine/threonine protein kinase, partial [uncultured Chloroflexia bacterium]